MDKFTKRFYEKGNENNKKSGGAYPQYSIPNNKSAKSKAKHNALNKKKDDGRSGGVKKTITRSEFNKTHSDYKGYREFNGVKKHPYVLQMGEHGTEYTPVKIRSENKGKTYIYPKNK